MSRSGQRSPWLARGIGIGVGVVLALAIGVTTTYTTAEEGAAIASGLNPNKDFNPAVVASELFPQIKSDLPLNAVDLPIFATEADADLTMAGGKYGQDLGAGSFAVPVVATGTVESVDDKFMTLTVDGIDEERAVLVPIGPALNGGPVRDALGIISFGDVPDQIAFQSLAQEIKALMKAEVLDPADPASLSGKEIRVYGAWASTSPDSMWLIQPVAIEVSS
ncbi:MAG: DUF2291 domain-containing protein [Candidatus Nanopelagicales bacterium]|nr:DUF2291 domain-containing protein [Candidatus Nanopelagicales bacterium]MCF8536738.1 DUF2291 domain-containing protein [Candidatus Nanopelagicales bacterium]MCF8541926.1 DUF2291 domain-containing protein [Candidatus Nanopelagicales bacterium]MCF8556929.1 DUF2291 domain-containing protein [Candidatus Nanopelagicales bacterium]